MSDLRRNDSKDPVVQLIANDPAVMDALDERAQRMKRRMRESVESYMIGDSKSLKAWVAIAVWEDEEGNPHETVMTDDHSTALEIKGMLHDALWSTAHADGS